MEKLSPPFGKGLAGLALLMVLITPIGKAASPVENVTKVLGVNK
jgi:hypothetical protein